MIRVMVSYPNRPGARFDEEYYLKKHCPMVSKKLTPHGMTGMSVDRGMGGLAPGSPADFLFQFQMMFNSAETLQAALAAEGPSIIADIPNYTELQPQIQVNQVVL